MKFRIGLNMLGATWIVCLLTNPAFGQGKGVKHAEKPAQTARETDGDDDETTLRLTYDQATALGLKANLDLIAAQYNIPMAEADEITASLWANPSLTIETSSQPMPGKTWNQTTGGGPAQYDFFFSIPVDLSGKHSTAKHSAEEATRIAKAAFVDTVRQKVQQIRLAYIDLLTFQQQLTVFKQKEDDLHHLLEMIKGRIGKKNLQPMVLRRAQLAYDQAVLNTEGQRVTVKGAVTNLAMLLGRRPYEKSIEATSKLRDFNMPKLPAMEKLLKQALENRPDLQAARLAVVKSDADIDNAKASVWDDFSVNLGMAQQMGQNANPGDPASTSISGATSWSAGIQIPLPTLNRNQGNIKKALLTKEQSEKQVLALEIDIKQEFDSLYDALKLNKHLIEEYEDTQLEHARKIHDAEQTQFGTGNSALLDYFDAMGAYYDTLTSYYGAVGEYRRAYARLQASYGKDEL